ncbi:peptide/nickel transport system substrate-binding protein [Orenia metallireducens]|uniref:Peptide/nickel transport system substrate-binding protein n=1 Tax=Orenia metallireducens TaxID=1413210 RepID=A0A285ICX7_9FIRM|nr:ABC transporter substrate-binding protein [Orenia metallireducens]PRX20685.1 peptide/nickel transport system substrate-binding protein [Orenia metallireducens]SNY44791.1 peptide/nickel transport system substrate-binding protein [Orenia metallireducens]
MFKFRSTILILMLVLVVTLVGCSGSDQSANNEKVETSKTAEKTQDKADNSTGQGATGAPVKVGKYGEAPMLHAKVEAGELPPVDERLPEEPMVVDPEDEVGLYGGTLQLTQFNTDSLGIPGQLNSEAPLTHNKDLDHLETIGNFVKDWKFTDGGKKLTLYLRKGVKWSDGEPLTVHDFVFWFEDVMQNKEISPIFPAWLAPGGEPMKVSALDDYTLEFNFKIPYYGFIDWINGYWYRGMDFFIPAHYLKQYHVKYNPDVVEMAEKEGYGSWVQLFNEQNSAIFTDPKPVGRPRLSAWVVKEITTTGRVYERNPYYWKVDSEGNQLPYIDKIKTIITPDAETRKLKILSGNIDYASAFLSLKDYPTFKANEESGGYDAWIGKSIWANRVTLGVQHQYQDDPVMAKILANKKFRQALSIAINREEINELVFLGQGTPRQLAYTPGTVPVYKEEWAQSYAQYDPETAKQWLDEIGLKDNDGDGYRERPDGEILILNLTANSSRSVAVETSQLARDYWENIGIKVNLKTLEEGSLWQQLGNGKSQILTQFMTGSRPPWDQYNPAIQTHYEWGNWFNYYNPFDGTVRDIPEGADATKPPQYAIDWYTWGQMIPHVNEEKQKELLTKIGDMVAEQVPSIGTVGMAGHVGISNKGLGNVRRVGDNPSVAATKNAYVEQFYWKDAARRNQ